MAEYARRGSGSSRLSSITPQDQKKKQFQERKKSILYLILDYLKDHNLLMTHDALKREAQLSDQFTVCDNVDLDIVFQEFQSYYNLKFQREPKIIRKLSHVEETPVIVPPHKVQSAGRTRSSQQTSTIKEKPGTRLDTGLGSSPGPIIQGKDDEFQFEIISIESQDHYTTSTRRKSSQISEQEKKPLADFSGYTQEWREIADQIMKEFIPKTLGYSWQHCIGLEGPMELLKEATIYPFLYPSLFQNLTTTWNGILLYGPPGTGKTLLAKALACEGNTNFINVMSSTFVSKWRGDSEKMIKVLFDLAKYYAPTTIFIDEIDALLSETKETNHEASCRFKSELLIQMDGLMSYNDSVFLLATTNSPWTLDKALLRRFEKRILIPLPDEKAKLEMLQHYTKWKNDNKNDLSNLIQLTENFSGSDIKNVCKEMEMSLVREQLKEINKKKTIGARRNATLDDLISAVKTVKPTTSMEYYKKLLDWHDQYGSN